MVTAFLAAGSNARTKLSIERALDAELHITARHTPKQFNVPISSIDKCHFSFPAEYYPNGC
jgi:hypothetical protein